MKLPKDVRDQVLAASARPSARVVAAVTQSAEGPLHVVVTVPGLVVVSEANDRSHWAARRRRARDQQAATLAALVGFGPEVRDRLRAAHALVVRFTRVGGRKLDCDNLVGGFKAVRDQVAKWLGIDDGSDRIAFPPPAQEAGERGIRIEIVALPGPTAKHR